MLTRTRALTGGGSNGSPRTSAGTADQSYSPPRLISGRRKKYGWVRSASRATVSTKRRVTTALGATVGAPSSNRSSDQPLGASIEIGRASCRERGESAGDAESAK